MDCPGRTVKANVNNISPHEFDNTRLAEIISGGLRDGTNSLTLNFSDSPKSGPVLINVTPELLKTMDPKNTPPQASAGK